RPSLFAISTYDCVKLIANAIARAGTLNGPAVRRALAATTGFSGVYWGPMAFNASGDLRGKTYVLWTIKGGVFRPLG
ncbi:MAG: ABC transporter substrate-binding protein, partial [Chloroflexota bacterium]